MRGHHFIFPRSLQQEAVLDRPKEIADDMVEFCVHLFAAPDLRSIKSMISVLPREEQKQLFRIYLQQMQMIKEQNKLSMN